MKRNKFANIESIIRTARRGGMYILVDDENRENEGDLVFCASDVSANKVNFMAKYGRGLICLALNSLQAKKLNLKIMLGCMVSSSLSMIPLLPLYQFADFIDLDGPCFISHDRENGLIYEKGMILLNRDLCWG